MRDFLIDTYLGELVARFGKPRKPVPRIMLSEAFSRQDYGQMIRIIREPIAPQVRTRLGRVTTERGPKSALWFTVNPKDLPQTIEITKIYVSIYIREEQMRDAPLELWTTSASRFFSGLMLHVSKTLYAKDIAMREVASIFFGFGEYFLAIQKPICSGNKTVVVQRPTDLTTKEVAYVLERLKALEI